MYLPGGVGGRRYERLRVFSGLPWAVGVCMYHRVALQPVFYFYAYRFCFHTNLALCVYTVEPRALVWTLLGKVS